MRMDVYPTPAPASEVTTREGVNRSKNGMSMGVPREFKRLDGLRGKRSAFRRLNGGDCSRK